MNLSVNLLMAGMLYFLVLGWNSDCCCIYCRGVVRLAKNRAVGLAAGLPTFKRFEFLLEYGL